MNCDERSFFQLHFQFLLNAGRSYSFPCDAGGHVDLDALSDHVRNNYFYARALVGRDFSPPQVQPGTAS
jgi:hypothetical protein